jgi:TetR/AcrR family transcriptional regulator, transcriptional repressor for nem operon
MAKDSSRGFCLECVEPSVLFVRIFHACQEGIATALRAGQSQGTVRRNLVPEETASFLIAMVEGYEVLAKNAQDAKVWSGGIRNIVGWLSSLRAPGNRDRG